jgi:poly(3-hydroxybutyrate) depolymerase
MNNLLKVTLLISAALFLSACRFDPCWFNLPICKADGLKVFEMPDGSTREYYLRYPAEYDEQRYYPLVLAFHGSNGSYENFVGDSYYNLESSIGDEAILVYPQGLPDGAGINQWNFDFDIAYFDALISELDSVLIYDTNRLFVTGHSGGGGMSNELGCQRGDVIRAIAPVAGAMISTACTGSVAVMAIHGEEDPIIAFGIGENAKNNWVLYNGFEIGQTIAGMDAHCENYAINGSEYPVQWCPHADYSDAAFAHDWPDFAGPLIWEFFKSLPEVAPHSDHPVGGGNDRLLGDNDTTLTITLEFPAELPEVEKGGIVLYPAGVQMPIVSAPIAFLATEFDMGEINPGSQQTFVVPIKFQGFGGGLEFPATYSIQLAVYVVGGGYPIPTTGVDYVAIIDYPFVNESTPVVIPGVIDVQLLEGL